MFLYHNKEPAEGTILSLIPSILLPKKGKGSVIGSLFFSIYEAIKFILLLSLRQELQVLRIQEPHSQEPRQSQQQERHSFWNDAYELLS